MKRLTNLLAITLLTSCVTAFAQEQEETTTEKSAVEQSADIYADGYNKFRFGGYGEILANFMDYGITPRKTASLLDTFSCISQGILPYGAQMLVAISAVHELGYELSAFEIMANLFYPGMLLVSSLIFIFVLPDRKNAESNA